VHGSSQRSIAQHVLTLALDECPFEESFVFDFFDGRVGTSGASGWATTWRAEPEPEASGGSLAGKEEEVDVAIPLWCRICRVRVDRDGTDGRSGV
jgi:hypothetical protein